MSRHIATMLSTHPTIHPHRTAAGVVATVVDCPSDKSTGGPVLKCQGQHEEALSDFVRRYSTVFIYYIIYLYVDDSCDIPTHEIHL